MTIRHHNQIERLICLPVVGEVRDLSHTPYESFPTFSGDKCFTMELYVNWAWDRVNLPSWTLTEHRGAHMMRQSMSPRMA